MVGAPDSEVLAPVDCARAAPSSSSDMLAWLLLEGGMAMSGSRSGARRLLASAALGTWMLSGAGVHAGSMSASALQSGNWSSPASWSGMQVPANGMPGPGDTWHVLIEENLSVANDLTVTIDRLTLAGDAGGTPILGNGVRDISVAELFLWKRGAVGPAGLGRLRILDGATATLSTATTKILRQDLAVEGLMQLSEGQLAGTNAARLLNLDGGEIEYAPGFTLSNVGLVSNESGSRFHALAGGMGQAANAIAWMFDSEAGSTVQIEHPTRFNGGGVYSGDWMVAADTVVEFGGFEAHVWRPTTLQAPSLRVHKAGASQLDIPANSAVQQIAELDVSGGHLRFDRNVAVSSGGIDSARVSVNSQAEFESLVMAIFQAQLDGNGRFFFPDGSQLGVAGSNVIDAQVDIGGEAVVAAGSSVFFGPQAEVNVLPGAELEVNGAVQFAPTGSPPVPSLLAIEHDAAMFINFGPTNLGVVVNGRDPPASPDGRGVPQPARIVLAAAQCEIMAVEGLLHLEIDAGSSLSLGSTADIDALSRLSGAGTVAPAQAGATLVWPAEIDPRAPGGNTATLHVAAALELQAASQLQMRLGSSSDLVEVSGGLRLDGTLAVEAGSGFGPGSYTLVDFNGELVDAGLTVSSGPGGFEYQVQIDQASSQVRLLVTLADELHADGFESP